MSQFSGVPKLHFARAAALCALAIAIAALGLGMAGITEPRSFPFLYPMRHTTAFAIGMMSISLVMLIHEQLQLSRIAAYFATGTGVLALIAQVLRWNRTDLGAAAPLPPFLSLVYTAFPNALSFVMSGIVLALLAGRRLSVHRSVLATIAGAMTATLALCSLMNEFIRFLPANPAFESDISVDATFSLALVGWTLARVALYRAGLSGEAVRVYQPVTVAVLCTLASFIVWRSLLQERSTVIAYQTGNTTNAMARAVRSELSRRLREVRYSAEEPTPTVFQDTGLVKQPNVRWTDLRALGHDDSGLRQLILNSSASKRSFYAIHAGPDNRSHAVFATPLRNGSLRVAVLPLRNVLEPISRNVVGPNFQMFLLREGTVIYADPDPPRESERTGLSERYVPELDGVIRVQAGSTFIRRGASWASHMVLAIGLNASFLLAFSAYLLHVARERLDEVQTIRRGLEREVEQRREAEAELARKAKQLEGSNADLREFAHVTSHDLQEPLRSINGFAQLLARRYKTQMDADADEFLDYITDSSNRMTAMIQGLLAYSRLVHSSELDEEVPLADVLDWARSNLMLAIEESGAQIEVGCQLPLIRGNRLQFCQLFQNLLGNALKYRGTEPLVIRIECDVQGAERVFTVQDSGIGIAPEYQDRIFGLFKRAHGKDYPGAGVGLALCKKIVERHGGRIWVESTPGKGAAFRFTLPA